MALSEKYRRAWWGEDMLVLKALKVFVMKEMTSWSINLAPEVRRTQGTVGGRGSPRKNS